MYRRAPYSATIHEFTAEAVQHSRNDDFSSYSKSFLKAGRTIDNFLYYIIEIQRSTFGIAPGLNSINIGARGPQISIALFHLFLRLNLVGQTHNHDRTGGSDDGNTCSTTLSSFTNDKKQIEYRWNGSQKRREKGCGPSDVEPCVLALHRGSAGPALAPPPMKRCSFFPASTCIGVFSCYFPMFSIYGWW